MRFRAAFVGFIALLCLMASAAFAQPSDDARAKLDAARQTLDRIETMLTRDSLGEAELTRGRADLDQAAASVAETLAALQPRYDSAKARLDQLGPAPGEKGPPESAAAAAERQAATQTFNDLDALVKRARLLAVQAEQTNTDIVSKRRANFANAVLARSSSILSPWLWRDVALDLPRDWAATRTLGSDWLDSISTRRGALGVALLCAYFAALALLYAPLRRLVERVLHRSSRGDDPTDLHRAVLALWTLVVMATLPMAAVAGGLTIVEYFGLAPARFSPLLVALGDGVARVAATAGMAWGVLAPGQPKWRMFDLSEPVVERIIALAVNVALVVSATRIAEAGFDVVGASLVTTVAVRGVGSLVVAAMLVRGLNDIMRRREASGDDRYAALRVVAWIAAIFIAASAIAGFVALSSFLVSQLAWLVGVVSLAIVLTKLTRFGVDAMFEPDRPVGRMLTTSVGLKRESLEQIAVVISGALTMLVIVVAALLLLARWGIESQDLYSYVSAAFFGVKVGDVTISLSAVISALTLLVIGLVVTKAIQSWLDSRFLPATHLDTGLRNAIRTSFGYVGVFAAIALALSYLGLGLDRLALVAGALSVGIGLGLQSVVSNFVSGLILLWERAIRVGDWIVVGTDQGYVRRINVRSTEIETFDRALVVMPNSNLITGVVTNWVRGDRIGRVKIPVGVSYEADPEQVRDLLIAAAKEHESVLKIPAPNVLFTSFGDSALMFELVCFVEDVEAAGRVKSDLHFSIFKAMRENAIEIPFPQRDMNIRGVDRLVEALSGKAAPQAGGAE